MERAFFAVQFKDIYIRVEKEIYCGGPMDRKWSFALQERCSEGERNPAHHFEKKIIRE